MNFNKRLLGIFFILITMTVGVFGGCGSKNSTDADGRIKVEFWYGLGGKLQENMEGIIEEFNNSQDKYKVVGITQDSYESTYRSLQSAISAKKTPSIALIEGDKQYSLAKKNLLTDISDLASKDGNFDEKNYLDGLLKSSKINDRLYSFPMYGTTQVFYYNKQVLKDAGLDKTALDTWQGVANVARKVSKKENGETTYYGWEPMYGADNLIDISLSNGGNILSEDGKKVLINSEEWIEVWENVRSWIHEEKIMRIHFGGQGWQYWYDTIEDVMQDRAFGYTGSSGDAGDLDLDKLSIVEQPKFKDGKESRPIVKAKYAVIPSCSNEEAKQGAYDFIKYFTSSKVSAKWSVNTGYIPVNKASSDEEELLEIVKNNPDRLTTVKQATHVVGEFIDPTGGKILDALKIAADKVEVENVSAKEALDEAQKIAQEELDAIKDK